MIEKASCKLVAKSLRQLHGLEALNLRQVSVDLYYTAFMNLNRRRVCLSPVPTNATKADWVQQA